MTGGLALDAVLALAVVGVALAALRLRDAFGAVVAFIAFGLLLALVWVRIGAPDVALTEAAIGGGVTGVMLIGAATRLRAEAAPPGLGLRLAAGVLCATITAGLAAAVLLLPEPGPSLAVEAAAHLPGLGLGNPVTGVLLAYRAIDTFMEAVVLVVALIAIWSLAPDDAWGGRPGAVARQDGALGLLAGVLPPIGLLLGVHLFWVGAEAPGGAFQGGTILAAMWILAWMAGRVEPPRADSSTTRWLIVLGPVLFLAVGLLGFVVADGFLAYPAGWAKPLILGIEAALTLSIAAALALMVAGWPAR
ncbi:hydrogenase subunit MbhD domain-containing protein [Humitalea sp. 24SJ18S-53]|uniref:hydrogenase subunit MbhD domain-containing protein n=1 Tax=Humitalea sp. 24SJ18S-53 TaxID=3422307 RepID=UPI003D66CBD5